MKIVTAVALASAITFFSLVGDSQTTPDDIFADGALGGTVTAVESVDTIEIDGTAVHLAGVHAPNRWWIGRAPGCYSGEAKKFLEDAILGKKVEYVFVLPEGGKKRLNLFYHLPRVYLKAGALFVNEGLVKTGHAFADHHPDYRGKKEFLEFEAYAKRNAMGLWNSCIVECRAKKGCRTLVILKSSIL